MDLLLLHFLLHFHPTEEFHFHFSKGQPPQPPFYGQAPDVPHCWYILRPCSDTGSRPLCQTCQALSLSGMNCAPIHQYLFPWSSRYPMLSLPQHKRVRHHPWNSLHQPSGHLPVFPRASDKNDDRSPSVKNHLRHRPHAPAVHRCLLKHGAPRHWRSQESRWSHCRRSWLPPRRPPWSPFWTVLNNIRFYFSCLRKMKS